MRVRDAVVRSLAVGCILHQQRQLANAAFVPTSGVANRKVGSGGFGAVRRFNSGTELYDVAKKDQSFPTWSYDEPCLSMEWSSLIDAEMDVVTSSATIDSLTEDSDLVLIGVMAPPKGDDDEEEEDEDEKDEDDKDKEPEVMELTGLAKEVDDKLAGALTDVLTENAKTFKNGAKMGSTTPVVRVVSDGKAKRYCMVGLGATPKEDDDDDNGEKKDPFEGAGAAVGKAVATKCNAEKKVKSCAVLLPDVLTARDDVVQDLSAAFYQSLYADNRYRTGAKVKKPAEDLETVTIQTEGSGAPASSRDAVAAGKKLAAGIFMTKDIVNAPHNVLNSLSLADTAKRIAEESGGVLQCTILGKKECEERGMGAYLGVARGSETEPQFIHLTYNPPGPDDDAGAVKRVGVIGKGLLFDTGGYNIKTSMMELMKFDCGGSAAVLGAARAVAALKPPGVEAHFIVAACENMINQRAVVPSDILTASNGKTIEVMNTDAEGRLTLADALVYADKELGCESIIELSTLTGACMVSLGKQLAGVFTQNDDLAEELAEISKLTGDKSWRMPMAKEYNELLESKFADIKNIGGRYGGAITAALFLQNFVSSKKPFAHIDIAGPVWNDKLGATGYGAKLVTEWVKRQGAKEEE